MFKKLFIFLIALSSINVANAMQINLNFDKDMSINKNPIAWESHRCVPVPNASGVQCSDVKVAGMKFDAFDNFLSFVNKTLSAYQPLNDSYLTLGYTKNNMNVYPESCNKMPMRALMNITMSENGCAVN